MATFDRVELFRVMCEGDGNKVYDSEIYKLVEGYIAAASDEATLEVPLSRAQVAALADFVLATVYADIGVTFRGNF